MELNESKISTELNLALNTPLDERIKSLDLNVGYIGTTDQWELIVKHTGNLDALSKRLEFDYVSLLNGYGIIRINSALIGELSRSSEIIYIEKPKSIYEERDRIINGFSVSCMSFLETVETNLNGRGVTVAVIDSGIDYNHPVFWNNERTKIIQIWDQTGFGNPPSGYDIGVIYEREDIERGDINTTDATGHGTAVAGIIANIADGADLLVIKLASGTENGYPTTISLMMAIDYAVKFAIAKDSPLVINLSFGNNYGDHNSNSILEDYIDSVSTIYRMSVVVGTGNDGDAGRHYQFMLGNVGYKQVDIRVNDYETAINLQLWRDYSDVIDIVIRTPSYETIGPFSEFQQIANYSLPDMNIGIIYGAPSPINASYETYISIIPKNQYIESGIWSIFIYPKSISNGRIDIWLPVTGSTSSDVYFLSPSEYTTLTIPSTAKNVISVGAYDSINDTYATFSGRGYTVDNSIKPDIVAPGVDIDVAVAGGKYGLATGTSFAAPFVSAGAAIMMEDGIVNGKDPFFYGEKIKAYMIKGARKLPGYRQWPNEKLGWGAFCLERSML